MRFQLPRISEAKDYLLTAMLLVFSIVLLVGRNQGGINTLRKVSVTLFSYLEEPLSTFLVYQQALKTNTELRKQNILLLDKLNRMRAVKERNDELQNLLNFSRNSDLSLYPVQVVGKRLDDINNTITVDAGRLQGIEKGMPFISAQGLVGKVVLTADNYSQIMPYANALFRVSATLRQSNALGIVSWNSGKHQLILNYVPQTTPVDSGEVVLTSGYSNQFPANLPIGQVVYTEPNVGEETQRIYIQPFANLNTIAEGFIVTTEPDTAIKSLNKQYKELFK